MSKAKQLEATSPAIVETHTTWLTTTPPLPPRPPSASQERKSKFKLKLTKTDFPFKRGVADITKYERTRFQLDDVFGDACDNLFWMLASQTDRPWLTYQSGERPASCEALFAPVVAAMHDGFYALLDDARDQARYMVADLEAVEARRRMEVEVERRVELLERLFGMIEREFEPVRAHVFGDVEADMKMIMRFRQVGRPILKEVEELRKQIRSHRFEEGEDSECDRLTVVSSEDGVKGVMSRVRRVFVQ